MTRRPLHPPRQAFSLTELLIVIAIMVLVLAAAVPAFRFMTGSRSVDAAQNNLAAILGRARATALSLQKQVGVFFYLDPSGRTVAALVQEADYPTTGAPTAEVYLDLIADQDVQLLPPGVGVQVVDDCDVDTSGNRGDDGYIGFNVINSTVISFGGVILFDGKGRLESKTYGFLLKNSTTTTAMGELLYQGTTPSNDYITPTATRSQIGLVVYESDAFTNAGGTLGDPQIEPPVGYPTTEKEEEIWIDTNALPLIVNRYNGTLIRGE